MSRLREKSENPERGGSKPSKKTDIPLIERVSKHLFIAKQSAAGKPIYEFIPSIEGFTFGIELSNGCVFNDMD